GNVIFSIVELTRPNPVKSNIGFFTTPIPSFDTVCIKSSGKTKTFTVSGLFLNDSVIVIGPLGGYKFSSDSNNIYSDSLILKSCSPIFKKDIYIQFKPDIAGIYNGNVTI